MLLGRGPEPITTPFPMDPGSCTSWPTQFPVELQSSKLFAHQSSLPKLPVPSLQETLQRFMQSNLPLLSHDEYKTMLQKVRLFLDEAASESKGQVSGRTLQARLLERAQKKPSWLLEWWNDDAYLKDREPIVFFVSYFFGFNAAKIDVRTSSASPQVAVAARIVQGALRFYKDMLRGAVAPDSVRDKPLCSHMYRYLFNACRMPGLPYDTTVTYNPHLHQHIAVFCRGHVYVLQVVDGLGNLMPTATLERHLEAIVQQSDCDAALPLGLLTSMSRDEWALARAELVKHSDANATALELIASAIFSVSLDVDVVPGSLAHEARTFWHGDAANRFYDKSVQFIVTKNGKAGMLGEHSMMDGMITSRLCETLLQRYIFTPSWPPFFFILLPPSLFSLDTIDHENKGFIESSAMVNKLEFGIPKDLKAIFSKARKDFADTANLHVFDVLSFKTFGKGLIKRAGMSPDAFLQMAFQLAHFKLVGKLAATYESTQTRAFAYGRTEVTRSCSVQALRWVRSMEPDSRDPADFKLDLLKQALDAHTAYMANAALGKGIDRHLMGLIKCVKSDETMPELFSDPSFIRSKTWTLSTSQMSSPYYSCWGWGNVVADGYGLPYSILEDEIYVGICSRGKSAAFKHSLEEALIEMQALLQAPQAKL